MLLTMTNESPIFNDQSETVEIIFKRLETAISFRMLYTYSSRTKWVMILVYLMKMC